MIEVICPQCQRSFLAYPSHIRRGTSKHCSRVCGNIAKLGLPSYVRTEAQRQRMSEIVAKRDLTLQRDLFAALGHAKKGKTVEELYGPVKGAELRAKAAKIGEANPNWRGGQTRNRYPYIFFKMRQQILERDGYTCQNCSQTEAEAKAERNMGRGLTIHHIDYDKFHNEPGNMITLCRRCNSTANRGREAWQQKYTTQLLGLS